MGLRHWNSQREFRSPPFLLSPQNKFCGASIVREKRRNRGKRFHISGRWWCVLRTQCNGIVHHYPPNRQKQRYPSCISRISFVYLSCLYCRSGLGKPATERSEHKRRQAEYGLCGNTQENPAREYTRCVTLSTTFITTLHHNVDKTYIILILCQLSIVCFVEKLLKRAWIFFLWGKVG